MSYEIVFAPDAHQALRSLRAFDRAAILDAIEQHLRHEPTKISRSRIKRLREMRHPQFRLRIGAHRAFYDVSPGQVEIIAVVSKAEAADWLHRWGIRTQEDPP